MLYLTCYASANTYFHYKELTKRETSASKKKKATTKIVVLQIINLTKILLILTKLSLTDLSIHLVLKALPAGLFS